MLGRYKHIPVWLVTLQRPGCEPAEQESELIWREAYHYTKALSFAKTLTTRL